MQGISLSKVRVYLTNFSESLCIYQQAPIYIESVYIPYLPEYKSQLQHLFLLLFIKGASYTPNIV